MLERERCRNPNALTAKRGVFALACREPIRACIEESLLHSELSHAVCPKDTVEVDIPLTHPNPRDAASVTEELPLAALLEDHFARRVGPLNEKRLLFVEDACAGRVAASASIAAAVWGTFSSREVSLSQRECTADVSPRRHLRVVGCSETSEARRDTATEPVVAIGRSLLAWKTRTTLNEWIEADVPLSFPAVTTSEKEERAPRAADLEEKVQVSETQIVSPHVVGPVARI